MRITTYLQSIEKKEFIINACQRSRLHKTNTSVRRGRRILLFLQRTRELVYMSPAPALLVYILRRSAVVVVALLYSSTTPADTQEELN
jgi:hypothetical protein